MKHRLRPQRSVSLPPGIISAAITSKNSVIAVCTPCTVVSRSSLMSLIITFMFEPAKLQMNWARASGSSARRSAGDIRPPPTACAAVTAAARTGRRDDGRRRCCRDGPHIRQPTQGRSP